MKEFLQALQIAPTELRMEILSLLSKSDRAMAYDDILSQIKANKTTIYRNLQLFEAKSIVIKSEIGRKSFYTLASGERAYFLCNICAKIHPTPLPAGLGGDRVMSAVLKGVCQECDK